MRFFGQGTLLNIAVAEHEPFFVGKLSDGTQVLMGLQFPSIVALFFSPAGQLVKSQTRSLPADLLSLPYNPDGGDWRQGFLRAVRAWQREIGFSAGPIRVKPFAAPGAWTAPRPESFVEFVRDPMSTEPDETERAMMQKAVDDWDEQGRYVLHWTKEYWMNADGTVNST